MGLFSFNFEEKFFEMDSARPEKQSYSTDSDVESRPLSYVLDQTFIQPMVYSARSDGTTRPRHLQLRTMTFVPTNSKNNKSRTIGSMMGLSNPNICIEISSFGGTLISCTPVKYYGKCVEWVDLPFSLEVFNSFDDYNDEIADIRLFITTNIRTQTLLGGSKLHLSDISRLDNGSGSSTLSITNKRGKVKGELITTFFLLDTSFQFIASTLSVMGRELNALTSTNSQLQSELEVDRADLIHTKQRLARAQYDVVMKDIQISKLTAKNL